MEIIKNGYYTDGNVYFQSLEDTTFTGCNILGKGVRLSASVYVDYNHWSLNGSNLRSMTWEEINYLNECIKLNTFVKFKQNISPNYEIY